MTFEPLEFTSTTAEVIAAADKIAAHAEKYKDTAAAFFLDKIPGRRAELCAAIKKQARFPNSDYEVSAKEKLIGTINQAIKNMPK